MSSKLKAVSLFSSAGIGELSLHNYFDFVVANELLSKRAECYNFFYPETNMICGDLCSKNIKNEIINLSNGLNAKVLLATPPCQGLSTLGKNKVQDDYIKDPRNFLILEVLDIIDNCDFDYVLIENVPKFLDMFFPYNNVLLQLVDILNKRYSYRYNIDSCVINAKDYGVCQSRPRAIIKLWKPGTEWSWPCKTKEIPLKDKIGDLPSLKPGEQSNIKWHYAPYINDRIALSLRHTPPGQSAIANKQYYPKKKDGTRIKGFHNTYKRMKWNDPCPARTTYSGSVSSHNNVHPGRRQKDGTYSDPRVLSMRELFLVSSINPDIDFPNDCSDTFIRTLIGESIPPLVLKNIFSTIKD